MATTTATTPAAAPALAWVAAENKWSTGVNFSSADGKIATAWAANAKKFACVKADAMAKPAVAMTTDCNTVLGMTTGGCCYTVTGTGATAVKTATYSKNVAKAISAVYPLLKDASMNICATPTALAAVPGWNATTGMVDLTKRFGGKTGAGRTELKGAMTKWVCSGAATLAASAVAATALISLV